MKVICYLDEQLQLLLWNYL